MGEEELTCVNCGDTDDYDSEEMCGVPDGTPLAREMNLDIDQLHENGFYPVCDDCFELYC